MVQIGALAVVTGIPARTIRFYEERGIVPAPPRTPSGYRDYDETAVARLRFLRAAQDAGLTLAEIAGVVALRDGGVAPCEHTEVLLRNRRSEVEDRIDRLKRLLGELEGLLAHAADVGPDTCDPAGVCSVIPS